MFPNRRARSRSRSRNRRSFGNTRPAAPPPPPPTLFARQPNDTAIPLPWSQPIANAPEPKNPIFLAKDETFGSELVSFTPPTSSERDDGKLDAGIEQFQQAAKPENLKFCCQLAHGSPTAILSNFNGVAGLFDQIAEWFKLKREDIIFCTRDTFKPDMEKLFSGTLDVSEMLFVHIRGQPTEVELTKTSNALGVTIADNGLCRSFIKRIKPGSTMESAMPAIRVGQLIESLNGKSMLGLRHYEVARALRSVPIGSKIKLRLVSPLESGFSMLQPRNSVKANNEKSVKNGLGTIRFKAEGGIVVQTEEPDMEVVKKLNDLFETYLGVQDDQLAMSTWEIAKDCENFKQLQEALNKSELSMFDFPEELVFDIFGIAGDVKRNSIKSPQLIHQENSE